MTKVFQPFKEVVSIDILNEDLKGITKFCNKIKNNFPSVMKSNNGGYQSPSLLHPTLNESKPMWNLFATIQRKLQTYTEKMNCLYLFVLVIFGLI